MNNTNGLKSTQRSTIPRHSDKNVSLDINTFLSQSRYYFESQEKKFNTVIRAINKGSV